MDMRSVRHQIEGREWQQRILEQQTSGLSIRKWRTEQNLRESQFYYWLRVLRGEELALQKPAGIFAELPSQSPFAGECDHGAAGISAVILGQACVLRFTTAQICKPWKPHMYVLRSLVECSIQP